MLPTIWFALWGVLWAVYFMLDGFDLGVGTLRPFLARTEEDRRVMLNATGPFWDGNEVWLITAGGVTFAAFPGTYAAMFSSLYTPLMLLLFGLILRGSAFELRGKVAHPAWVRLWDGCLFAGSLVPTLLFGVAFANLFAGIPVDAEGAFHGTLLTLLNPYGLAGGVLFVLLFLVHGALWLAIRTEGELHERAWRAARSTWPVLFVVAVTFFIATAFATSLYRIYLARPLLLAVPALAAAGLLSTGSFLSARKPGRAFAASGLLIAGTALFGVIGLYPNLLLSSLGASRTAFNSSSSPLTLRIMLGISLVTLPAVIAYQAWVHLRFSDRLKLSDLYDGESY
jgi:cytochrome d ubiquinol oxidase subunit II